MTMHHTHDPVLVALSILIAVFASYTALDLANSITVARGRARSAWLFGGSLAMGVGIWSMHFIGMLAFSLPGIPIAYDIFLLVLSVVVAIVASAFALSIVSGGRVTTTGYVLGSLAMGSAISGMHYIGIASMRMAATWKWNYILVATSVVIAVVSSFVALLIAFRLRHDLSKRGFWYRGAGGIAMGLAISGMHYTAMAAMTFFPSGPSPLQAEQVLATSGLAVAVVGMTLLILGIALTGSIVDRALARRLARTEQITRILARLQLALDATQMGTWMWEIPSGKITWDETNERLFGIPAGRFGGTYSSFEQLLLPEDRKPVTQAVQLAMENKRDFESEFRVRWPDGTVHWILSRGRPFFDARGAPTYFLGTSMDITERKIAEGKLRDALHARDEFISVASHELKTPITSMRLQTQMLNRAFKKGGSAAIEPARLAQMLDTSTRQLDRLTRLVEDMLDISRISTGKLTVEIGQHDLSRLVQDVLERFENECKQKGCEVHAEIEPEVIGYFDPFRIEQVVINLLSNALKYGGGKPISVTLIKKSPTRAELRVRDYGIGIPKEAQARIFDRFERAIPSRTISGLGLGLYIVKSILAIHHGQVRVESEPGQGALFTVELPLT
ncbi:MAG: MHYT domain-containing protein [Bdellovibrionales bacterium]